MRGEPRKSTEMKDTYTCMHMFVYICRMQVRCIVLMPVHWFDTKNTRSLFLNHGTKNVSSYGKASRSSWKMAHLVCEGRKKKIKSRRREENFQSVKNLTSFVFVRG